MIKAVVFDFDNVIRTWNRDETIAIEQRHGLPRGSIYEQLSDPTLIRSVTTGVLSDEEWRDAIAHTLAAQHGDAAYDAVRAWSLRIGDLDRGVLGLLRTLRSHFVVALLSNATTRLRSDLAAHDIADDFDCIFSTAEIGIAKPDPQVFAFVGQTLNVDPDEWLFVDDTAENVAAAMGLGVRSHVYSNLAELIEWLGDVTGIDFGVA
jgi:putative hydrolase of the HAD superfamily